MSGPLTGFVPVEIDGDGILLGHHAHLLCLVGQRRDQLVKFRLIVLHVLGEHVDVVLHRVGFERVLKKLPVASSLYEKMYKSFWVW